MVYKNRTTKKGGGVLIYVHERFKYRVRHDLSNFVEGEFETIFIEILNKNPAIVGEIYRVPNTSTEESLTRYERILQKLSNYKFP